MLIHNLDHFEFSNAVLIRFNYLIISIVGTVCQHGHVSRRRPTCEPTLWKLTYSDFLPLMLQLLLDARRCCCYIRDGFSGVCGICWSLLVFISHFDQVTWSSHVFKPTTLARLPESITSTAVYDSNWMAMFRRIALPQPEPLSSAINPCAVSGVPWTLSHPSSWIRPTCRHGCLMRWAYRYAMTVLIPCWVGSRVRR
jgi:hypothetical protein